MQRAFVLVGSLAACLAACSTNDLKQAGGGLATAGALLVALPLIPFVAVYHALNDEGANARRAGERWRQTFEPVYAKRTELLAKRDPTEDANTAAAQGHFAFLPSIAGTSFYSGLDQGEQYPSPVSNATTIKESELLSYLQTLMDDDPKDNRAKDTAYRGSSTVYMDFQAAAWRHRTVFNKRMAVLRTPTE